MSVKNIKNVGDLKELLGTFSDKTDIKMLIPYVEDWADIEIFEATLFRMKRKERCKLINLSNKYHHPETYKEVQLKDVKMPGWDILDGSFESESDEYKKLHQFKKVVMISNKSRNKSTFDRLGDIHY